MLKWSLQTWIKCILSCNCFHRLNLGFKIFRERWFHLFFLVRKDKQNNTIFKYFNTKPGCIGMHFPSLSRIGCSVAGSNLTIWNPLFPPFTHLCWKILTSLGFNLSISKEILIYGYNICMSIIFRFLVIKYFFYASKLMFNLVLSYDDGWPSANGTDFVAAVH